MVSDLYGIILITLSLLGLFVHGAELQKYSIATLLLSCWYLFESCSCVLSDEYTFTRVFKSFKKLVLF